MSRFTPDPRQPKCVSAGMKLCFNSQLAAERALAHIIIHGSAKQRPRRAYLCPYCKKWHLTSQEKRGASAPGRSYPDAITNPLDPPTVGGTDITVQL